jgi:hypothetical protein
VTIKGSTTPRIWTEPQISGPPGPCGCGCALDESTSLGFLAVEFVTDILGLSLIPWQRWLLIHAFELMEPIGPDTPLDRQQWSFRFRKVLVLVARQNGKTTLVDVKNLFKLFILHVSLVINTAYNLDVAEESWDRALEIIEAIPELHTELRQISRTNGKKFFSLKSGARWKPVAANRAGGRGASGDDVNLDELREHLSYGPWSAVTKTTNARPNAQVWAYSNAGDDRSIVLNDLVEAGRANADETLGYFEWSAPDTCKCTCSGRKPHAEWCAIMNVEAWAQANPSLGYTISERTLRSDANTDPEAVFRTECLCQRVPTMQPQWTIVPEEQWTSRRHTGERPKDVVLSVQVSYDRSHTSIAACGMVGDKRVVTLIEYRPGVSWVEERLRGLVERWDPLLIVMQDKGATATVWDQMPDRDEYGVGVWPRAKDREEPERGEIVAPWAAEVGVAHGLFLDAVLEPDGNLWHTDDAPVNLALANVELRPIGNGRTWQDRGDTDAGPLQADTLAFWGHVIFADKVMAARDAIGVW